jgi:hypothetical protein
MGLSRRFRRHVCMRLDALIEFGSIPREGFM